MNKNLKNNNSNGVMLNAYPDSIGKNLSETIEILKTKEFKDVFSLFYILPTFFNSDLDRGFSIIDYNINKELIHENDLKELKELNIELKFDIVLNHLSVASPQFQDLLEKGKDSEYLDFFINWNTFWVNNGIKNKDGLIIPDEKFLKKLFMRKPGLPILKVPFPDGSQQPYWNTFYQQIDSDSNKILGQMDVNAKSEKVWDFYDETLAKLKGYGCKIVRLDAFAYLHKEVGETNFFNKPGTWNYLSRIKKLAKKYNLTLLPEIHSEYGTYTHQEVSKKGYPIYDFFLPGLMIHTLETSNKSALTKWIKEITTNDYQTINMLGCHDGIPVLDLKGKKLKNKYNKGLLEDIEIESIIKTIIERGGRVKNLYGPNGEKISYYQVNATFFSALGENEKKLLLARAIQLFMPGLPQIWYLDLFAGKNDYKAADEAGSGGHKEINRTNLSKEAVNISLKKQIVQDQLELIRLRNTLSAFSGKINLNDSLNHILNISWHNNENEANLCANLNTLSFTVSYIQDGKKGVLNY